VGGGVGVGGICCYLMLIIILNSKLPTPILQL
jgi:hypothetical protein